MMKIITTAAATLISFSVFAQQNNNFEAGPAQCSQDNEGVCDSTSFFFTGNEYPITGSDSPAVWDMRDGSNPPPPDDGTNNPPPDDGSGGSGGGGQADLPEHQTATQPTVAVFSVNNGGIVNNGTGSVTKPTGSILFIQDDGTSQPFDVSWNIAPHDYPNPLNCGFSFGNSSELTGDENLPNSNAASSGTVAMNVNRFIGRGKSYEFSMTCRDTTDNSSVAFGTHNIYVMSNDAYFNRHSNPNRNLQNRSPRVSLYAVDNGLIDSSRYENNQSNQQSLPPIGGRVLQGQSVQLNWFNVNVPSNANCTFQADRPTNTISGFPASSGPTGSASLSFNPPNTPVLYTMDMACSFVDEQGTMQMLRSEEQVLVQ